MQRPNKCDQHGAAGNEWIWKLIVKRHISNEISLSLSLSHLHRSNMKRTCQFLQSGFSILSLFTFNHLVRVSFYIIFEIWICGGMRYTHARRCFSEFIIDAFDKEKLKNVTRREICDSYCHSYRTEVDSFLCDVSKLCHHEHSFASL